MKYIITKKQFDLITEQDENILELPFSIFGHDWNLLQQYIKRKGNPLYKLKGNIFLESKEIETLGSLYAVDGYVHLFRSTIGSLGMLTSVRDEVDLSFTNYLETLGNLTSVGESLYLGGSDIKSLGKLSTVGGTLDLSSTNIDSFNDLTSVGGDVGGDLDLRGCPLSSLYSSKQIKNMIDVFGNIHLSNRY